MGHQTDSKSDRAAWFLSSMFLSLHTPCFSACGLSLPQCRGFLLYSLLHGMTYQSCWGHAVLQNPQSKTGSLRSGSDVCLPNFHRQEIHMWRIIISLYMSWWPRSTFLDIVFLFIISMNRKINCFPGSVSLCAHLYSSTTWWELCSSLSKCKCCWAGRMEEVMAQRQDSTELPEASAGPCGVKIPGPTECCSLSSSDIGL